MKIIFVISIMFINGLLGEGQAVSQDLRSLGPSEIATRPDSNRIYREFYRLLDRWENDKVDLEIRLDLADGIESVSKFKINYVSGKEAIRFLENVMPKVETDNMLTSVAAFCLAKYLIYDNPQMEDLARARNLIRDGMLKDPSRIEEGEALVAKLYAVAVQIPDSSHVSDRALYWLVIDHYERARKETTSNSLGPFTQSVRSYIETIRMYESYMPTQRELVEWGLLEGERFAIDYKPYEWVNEETTIRAVPQR